MTKKKKPGAGFASMDPKRHKEVSALGGKGTPYENRLWVRRPDIAAKEGSKPKGKKK